VVASKPRLLYLSPVVPGVAGNGLAMRAGMVLEALAQRNRLYLLVIPLYPPFGVPVPAPIARLCHEAVVQPVGPPGLAPASRPLRWLKRVPGLRRSPPADVSVQRPFQAVGIDVVHVFRLSMLPFARPYFAGSCGHVPKRHLDLDDVESVTHRRLGELYRRNGNAALAGLEEREAQRYEALEDETLREFARVYVCSAEDRERLRHRSSRDVCILPNAVRVPVSVRPKPSGGSFTFLFVGTLGYYPNEDGIRYFCSCVLPLIRQMAPRAFNVTIVGTGATDGIRQLAHEPEVRLVGAVPDVAPYYFDADAAVVPVRAGGGTRIKVLEAFSYRRAVVSTSIGIEGIAAHDEEHVLVADTADAFAERCIRLMRDTAVAERLTDNALSLVRRAYSLEAIARTVAAFP
jgi:glycosyltransferase involved in cell wall biosynthesis